MQTLPPSGMPEVCKVLVVQAGFPALRSEKDKRMIGKRGGAIHVVRTQESHGSLSPPVAPQCDRTKQTRIVPAVLSPFCLVRAMACKLFCSDSGCRHRERWGDRGSSSHHRTCPYLCLITTLLISPSLSKCPTLTFEKSTSTPTMRTCSSKQSFTTPIPEIPLRLSTMRSRRRLRSDQHFPSEGLFLVISFGRTERIARVIPLGGTLSAH